MTEKWDLRFLSLAKNVSTWSKDPSTKVGSVLVSPDRTKIFIGYNGFPRNMEDLGEWYNNREEKYDRIIHAEENAVLLAKQDVTGFTLYNYPCLPCIRCFPRMRQVGIEKFVATFIPETNPLYQRLRLDKTLLHMNQNHVSYILYPKEKING